ncbi:MAG: efflux RND transporter periplasmic adaptor subunit [Deltaproteobacteria bacterium]|nr:efflux RND transporter periplasmic adaptor subunit [Deltaproteobacteria bacterium]
MLLSLGLVVVLTGGAAGLPGAGPAWAAAEPGQIIAQPSRHEVVITGFTRPRAVLTVVSEVAGRCQKVLADVGQAIGPDGVFARLDGTFTRLELKASRVEEGRLASQVAYLQKEVDRHASLVRSKSAPQSSLDKLTDQLTQARLGLEAQKTQSEILAERLARFTITAPAGWLVTQRQVEPGQWVGQGKALAQVGDFATLYVPLALNQEEYQAFRHRLDQGHGQVPLTLPERGATAPAGLARVAPDFDPTTRKINLDLALSEAPGGNRGGIRAELRLELADPTGAVLVPEKALVRRYQESWLTHPDGKQVRVMVLGPGPGGLTRVQAPGLAPGQPFLVQP